jgi:DNA (cytosine-5)-methyltransferase 1
VNYLSVCSGVEAATVAWHPLGWKPLAFSEIEKFPSEVLAHHYPATPNLGDMTKYKEWNFGTDRLDLLVGGTPCQSFSVAGLRKGLDDPRGNLALVYCGILDKFRPKWFVWENVPGVLSSGGGRDFGSFLGAVAELGYGFSYRVLDAQYFGVAQRRRRVFVIGHLGDQRDTAKVLFESESLSRNIKQSRKTKESVAGYVESSFGQYREDVIAGTTKASGGVLGGGSETFLAIPIHAQATQFNGGGDNRNNDGKGNGLGVGKPGDPMNTLDTSSRHAVAYENHASDSRIEEVSISPTVRARWGTGGGNVPLVQSIGFTQCDAARDVGNNISPTLRSGGDGKYPSHSVATNMAVRRLTPVECERLQGFPDNYTNIKDKCPDGPRYKAMGNSMAVPVMQWIGKRIQMVEDGLL